MGKGGHLPPPGDVEKFFCEAKIADSLQIDCQMGRKLELGDSRFESIRINLFRFAYVDQFLIPKNCTGWCIIPTTFSMFAPAPST